MRITTWIALILLGLAWHSPAQAAPKARSVAIYPLQGLGTEADIVERIEDLLYAQVKTIQGVRLFERDAMSKLLQKSNKACAGDLGCLAGVGRSARTASVIYGTVASLGDSYVLDLKLIRVRGAREIRRQSISLSGDQAVLINGIRETVTQLIAPEQYVGSLDLRLDKPGAQVFVDGDLVGKTPLKPLDSLRPGKHALKIVLTGYTDFDRFVDVQFQRVTIVNVALSGTSIDATIEAAEATAMAEGGAPVIVVAEDKNQLEQQHNAWKSPLFLSGLGTSVTGLMLLSAGVTALLVANGQFAQLNNPNLMGPASDDDDTIVLNVGLSDPSLELFRDWYDQANGTWVMGQSLTAMGVLFVVGGGALITWDLLARPREVPVDGE